MGSVARLVRLRSSEVGVTALIAASLIWPSIPVLAQSPGPVADLTIVSGARVLSVGEVEAADITATDQGRQLIEGHVLDTMDTTVGPRTYAAYDFGDARAVLDTTTPFTVVAGSNESGLTVHQVVPRTNPIVAAAPVELAETGLTWSHVQDASATILTGDCWKRVMWWTVMSAPGLFPDIGPGSAYRVYGRELGFPRSSAGCEDTEGFRRAWIEFAPGSGWPGAGDLEPSEPRQHIGGGGDPAIRSVGFGAIYVTDLGTPPVRPDGSPDLHFGGVINQRWSALRTMGDEAAATGGVRWCLFFDHPTPDDVSFATRVSAVVPAGSELGSIDILSGQDARYDECPPPD